MLFKLLNYQQINSSDLFKKEVAKSKFTEFSPDTSYQICSSLKNVISIISIFMKLSQSRTINLTNITLLYKFKLNEVFRSLLLRSFVSVSGYQC
jgi:hypothetical protein